MCSGGAKYISAHGHNIPDLLEAIMKLFPLDTYNYSKKNVQILNSTNLVMITNNARCRKIPK